MIAGWLRASAMALALSALLPSARDCGGEPTPTPPSYGFWVGDVGPAGPLWSGPRQYPFLCNTYESHLGQPVVDNVSGVGSAVFPEVDGAPDYEAEPLGYSELCGIATRVDTFYLATDGRFRLYDPDAPPADVAQVELDGVQRDFLVRVETGTLNRFLYTIAMLAPYPEDRGSPETLDNSAWNGKLIYYLRGGVGIGHWQGEAAWHGGIWSSERGAFATMLANGYAIATSSGNETGVHYNMRLADETAWMVKEHFIETYGDPTYTVAIGGSGGGVQQYMFAQNKPGLIDAGIPLYAYPDMITQAIYVGDCNLLEQYMSEEVEADGAASKWATWSHREWIEGMSASDTVENLISGEPGSTECIEAWLFAEPLALNPVFTLPDYLTGLHTYGFPQVDITAVKWTHMNDLGNVYPTDARGFAYSPFDNVGVQYGLGALTSGKIDADEFLELNSCAGGWVDQSRYVMWDPINDPFDSRNMTRDPVACRQGVPSPRSVGRIDAIHAAYDSGHVFLGDIDIPMIDLRPYLEAQLDMHNSRQSFSTRARMLEADGYAGNQVIWFTSPQDRIEDRIEDALNTLDEYLLYERRPAAFTDKCFDASGQIIASGEGVWAGILDDEAPGACTQTYPVKKSPRIVAGDSQGGDLFKCGLKPVDVALADGTYGGVSFDADQEALLRAIFPDGVCDYNRPDVGRPLGL